MLTKENTDRQKILTDNREFASLLFNPGSKPGFYVRNSALYSCSFLRETKTYRNTVFGPASQVINGGNVSILADRDNATVITTLDNDKELLEELSKSTEIYGLKLFYDNIPILAAINYESMCFDVLEYSLPVFEKAFTYLYAEIKDDLKKHVIRVTAHSRDNAKVVACIRHMRTVSGAVRATQLLAKEGSLRTALDTGQFMNEVQLHLCQLVSWQEAKALEYLLNFVALLPKMEVKIYAK